MIIRYFLLLVLALPSYAIAKLNCNKSKGYSLSLRSPGKSLHHTPVSDQDGLGTCFANSLSTMLYTHIGKSVSVHHIAAASGLEKQQISYWDSKRAQTQLGDDNIEEYGDVCQTFNAMKERIYMCAKEDVPIESVLRDSGWMQKSLHNALSILYDNSTELKQLNKDQVKEVLDTIASTNEYFNQTKENFSDSEMCNDYFVNTLSGDDSLFFETKRSFKKFLEKSCLLQNDNLTALKHKRSSLTKREAIDKEIEKINSRINSICTISSEGQNVSSNLNSNGEKLYYEYLKDLKKGAKDPVKLKVDFKNPIKNFISKLQKDKTDPLWPSEIFMNQGQPLTNKDYKFLFNDDIDIISPERCKMNNNVKNSKFINLVNSNLTKSGICLQSSTTDALINALTILEDQRNINNKSSIPFHEILSNLDKSYDDYLLGIISPKCKDSTKSIRNEEYSDLECKDHLLYSEKKGVLRKYWKGLSHEEKLNFLLLSYNQNNPTQMVDLEFIKSIYKGRDLNSEDEISEIISNANYFSLSLMYYKQNPKIKEKKIKSAKSKMDNITSKQFNKGRSVSIRICASVLLDNNKSSYLDEMDCVGTGLSGNSGLHEVNVIGKRCGPTGQIEYQIQNSWGQGCPNKRHECNSNNGTIWIPENELMKNTLNITTLE